VLLYKSWLEFVNHSWESFEQSLTHAKICIDMLHWCSDADPTARLYFNRLDVERSHLKTAIADVLVQKPDLTISKMLIDNLMDVGGPHTVDRFATIAEKDKPFEQRIISLLEKIGGPPQEYRLDENEVDGNEDGHGAE